MSAKASKGNYASIDALGAVGGPKAVAALKQALARSEASEHTLAFRSAKALGLAGGSQALEALLANAQSPMRVRRRQVLLR